MPSTVVPALLFADLVDVRARLGVFDRAEVDGSLALVVQIGLGHKSAVAESRHRGTCSRTSGPNSNASAFVQSRPSSTLVRPKLQPWYPPLPASVALKANLAVVAQVGIDMRRGRLGGHVVPLGVKNVGRGTSVVAALPLSLVVWSSSIKARRAVPTLNDKVAVLVGNNSAVKLGSVAADKLDDGSRRAWPRRFRPAPQTHPCSNRCRYLPANSLQAGVQSLSV